MRDSPLFLKQSAMRKVVWALGPAWLASLFFYGWISVFMTALSIATCAVTEWLFVRKKGGRISEAVFVTAILYAMILPPTLPFYMLVLGALFAVAFGKMAFGGFGANVFNPAMVGRAFLYITFPVYMTGRWMPAARFSDFPAGFTAWRFNGMEALTSATPIHAIQEGAGKSLPLLKLLTGSINGRFESLGQTLMIGGGSLGESSAVLLTLGGLFLVYQKVAKWRLVLSFFAAHVIFQAALHCLCHGPVQDPLTGLLTGGTILGGFFMVTDPVSAVRTEKAQWLYGSFIAVMAVIIRSFSLFSSGLMFAILLGNMFGPLMDLGIRSLGKGRKR
ncbi:RnfABCDGE type electron transport complex subunit D [bacterium]|nr:RnfABCDGE type electron transport complex subunit D [bacterium]